MNNITTLRDLVGIGHTPAKLANAALILIDCQNTYREGLLQLEGVEPALLEAKILLDQARRLGVPVIHVQHDAGAGSPYDIRAESGQIADIVAPKAGEPVITKHYPNAFIQTGLEEVLKSKGVQNIVLAGFMTHMCIQSTAHGAFNLGFAPTIVSSATATRTLSLPDGSLLSANQIQTAALAMTRDLYAVVVDTAAEVC
ncbi:cysteine hydrolase family protein [Methylophilus aquaticus]|uniref:Cysteine hydrolase family protein n=1 Tax=Methylophilus aquaticus TaxID=1971610 RepID=A0ABT9JRX5_9PROT|nr:cysteine hydrolase family protein [Methylophilus aquaticus]MDP8567318.1 cysteine hydrolase family protein [Methylophilus aquaticus]